MIINTLIATLIPAHRVARAIITFVDQLIESLGIHHSSTAEEVLYTIIILLVALLLGWLSRKIVVVIVRKWMARYRSPFIEDMVRLKVVARSSHIVPPLVFLTMVPVAFETNPVTLHRIEVVVIVYFLIVLGFSIGSLLEILWMAYDRRDNTRNLPLRGILNISKGAVWVIIAIIIVSVIVDKSPIALLTGLGAFAAALMLIFKDSILGFVAGIQLSSNDMLHVGDWIEVPGKSANGIVTDVSLTAVKIRNWNNTTSTLPPYSLVQGGFVNWNMMHKRGRRQIEQSVLIDVTTVAPASPALIESIRKLPHMDDYITAMQRLADKGQGRALAGDGIPVNGSIDTNLGLFRAYIGLYLAHHPWVAQGEPLCMVRLMDQTPQGQPVQIYCYLNTTIWPEYEGIRSDIFEHIFAAAPAFGLSAFSSPTGRDVVNIANPHPQAMPYYGGLPLSTLPYQPRTNYMVPPNTSGDPGFPYSTTTTFPDNIPPTPPKQPQPTTQPTTQPASTPTTSSTPNS